MKERLYAAMAQTIGAYHRSVVRSSGKDPVLGDTPEARALGQEWASRHHEYLMVLVDRYFPHGCGFDNGTTLDLDASTDDKLVFRTSYHHMNDGGMYDGWTEHTITVKPSLSMGFRMAVGGRDRNQIKDHIHECFHHALGLVRFERDGAFFDPLATRHVDARETAMCA